MALARVSAVILLLGGVTMVAMRTGSAQENGDVAELSFSPSEGPPGSAINITGRCLYEGRPADDALVSLTDEPPTSRYASVSIPVAADGSVNGSLIVPVDAPPGQYRVGGLCFKSDFTIGGRIEAPFRVAGQPVTTTTTTTATTVARVTTTAPVTTTPSVAPAIAARIAPAATARAGQPNYTG